MCGIIGYKGNGNSVKIIENGLKSLEYRGYDSWGFCTLDAENFNLVKHTGKIGGALKSNFEINSSGIAIGHTRWATHGSVNEKNAHPHTSNDNTIIVVHNGIIENFQELKIFLKEKRFDFKTDTDTEIIPNLIQHYIKKGNDFKESFRKSLLKIEGSYAIVAIKKGTQDIMFGRQGSPLVLGIGEKEYFVASDVPAFLEHTKKVIYLDDGEWGMINNELKIFDLNGKPKQKEIKEINWNIEEAQKGSYPHFMLKEIMEQEETIKKAIEQNPEFLNKVTGMIKNAFGIFFVGCGTSYHACVSAAYEFSNISKKHVNTVLGSEFRNQEDFLTDKTLMFAVSQSGETADLLDAVKSAKKKGVTVISITNVMGSTLTRLSDENIMMNAGPEICVLSTKSYTSQLAILLSLAYSVAGKTEEGKQVINKVAKDVPTIINQNLEKIKFIASEIKTAHSCFLIGRDLAYPSALEGALKIKEVSYIHAEGFAGGELKHGTIALIEEGTPVIVLSTDRTRNLIINNAAEIKSRGGLIIGIDSKKNEVFDHFIECPEEGYADPISMIIPIQLLSYYLAIERECDPDKPRNLAKSVTVK